MTNFSPENQVKKFSEKLFRLEPDEFYMKIINKQPDESQEMFKNNGEYTKDSLNFAYISIYKVLLKRKSFMTQPDSIKLMQ